MGSAENQSFTYPSLGSNRRQIRLCQVKHRSNDEVHCSLETFDLDEGCPPYAALSYTWGDTTPTRAVSINGVPFHVRQNLWDYFTQGCLPIEDYIWVDQLSINQREHRERNAQVSIMADIYRRAKTVYVWLGNAGCHTAAAVEYLDSERGSFKDLEWQQVTRKPNSDEAAGLLDLLNRPYWNRLWITQELFFARSKVCCCGPSRVVEWLEIYNVIFQATGPMLKENNDDPYYPIIDPLCVHDSLSRFAQVHKESSSIAPVGVLMSLGTSLNFFMGKECHDARDTVFGLQGMVQHSERIEIDYSCSAEDVFYKTVRTVAATTRGSSPDMIDLGIIRGLQAMMRIPDDFLGVLEANAGLSRRDTVGQDRGSADDTPEYSSWPELVDSRLRWKWRRSETETEERWNNVMMALPWGSRSGAAVSERVNEKEVE